MEENAGASAFWRGESKPYASTHVIVFEKALAALA
jgi:hypothetical protein